MNNNSNFNDDLNYEKLKNSFKIFFEKGPYVFLTDGRALIKGNDGSLKNAPENDEIVKTVRALMHHNQEGVIREIKEEDKEP